ncbi:MAG: delta 1-pyrroline-5-carboxylate synthetase [archaeon]|nr:delta 1-pyrroline-5-carboxylate synthetase [archaeon]
MEWVVKIGGSLFPNDAIEVAKTIEGTKSLIVIGGGEFTNLIRKYDEELSLSEEITHKTAIDSMDILAKLVNDKVDSTQLAKSLEEAQEISNKGLTPILLTSYLLEENDPFEASWDVTSDSIAAYISHLINAKLLIVTNVNGIYTREPTEEGSKFIGLIDAITLLTFDETSIDLKLPSLLIEFGTNCYIVNGKYPERVLSLLRDDSDNFNFEYTKIIGD